MFDKRLISLVPGAGRRIAVVVLFKWLALLCNVGLMALIGLWLQQVFVCGLAAPTPPALMGAAILIAGRAACLYLSQKKGDELALLARATIQRTVYRKLLELGPSYEEQAGASEAMQTSVEGSTQLQVYFGSYLPQLFYAILAPVTLFLILVWTAGLPAVILMILVPLIPVSIVFVQKSARQTAREYWSTYVDLGGDFLEAIEGLTTLKIYQADERWHQKMNREAEGFRQATMKMLGVQLRSIVVMDLFAYCGAAVGIVIAVSQLAGGAISFMACFLVVFLSQEFFLPMRLLGSLFHTAMNGMAASKKMYAILDTPAPAAGSKDIDPARCDVTLEGVGYAYGDRVALRDASLTARRGKLVALVGPSGSGKSTIAAIVAGRKVAYTGRLAFGNLDAREVSTASLMRTVTLVGTDAHLFAGSLRDNLLAADPGASDEALWDALERARVAAFVRASGGLDLTLAEGGSNLSGGQRQRVALARALVRDTPIYVFDEATSSVDTATENALCALERELARDHAVIVVAHRLATVEQADEICVLDQGAIVEHGTHAELLSAGGTYARLWESQSDLASFAQAKGFAQDEATAAEEDEDAAGALRASCAKASSSEVGGLTDGRPARGSLRTLLRLAGQVKAFLPYVVLAVALGVVGHLCAIAIGAVGAYGVAAAAGQPAGLSVLASCVLVVVCGIVRGPARYGEQLSNHYIAFRLLAQMRDLIFSALRRLAPAKLEGRGKGDVVSLATSDVELLEVFYAHTVSPVVIAIIVCLAMLAFLGAHAPWLAGVALAAYLIVGVLVPYIAGKASRGLGERERRDMGALNAFVLDQLRGIGETMQYGRSEGVLAGLDDKTAAAERSERTLRTRSAAVEGATDAIIWLLDFAMMATAFALVLQGQLSVGAAFVCSFAFFSSFGPVMAVARLGTNLQQTVGAGGRVLDLLDEEPQTRDVTDGKDVAFTGATLDHVGFSYAGKAGAPILSDVSAAFPEGSLTCVVGKSGSGKSTLLKLLMRFWDPTSGSVAISGCDARQVNTASLRANEAYMTQDTVLFRGSIADNLRVVRPEATEGQIRAALTKASLDDFLARLPEGLDTQVGDLGDSLSGGERQRLGLARVFLHDAPLILLDEPTSALDALSEAAVMRAIAQGRQGKTVVLVSHRASTVSFADEVFRMESGRKS